MRVNRARRAPRIRPVILVILLLAAAPASAGQATGLHFERIGKAGGPPPEVITALHQDRNGYLWIGSRSGLLLFDGYSYTTFQHDPSDPGSITDNTIRTFYEDRDGSLWIGTNTGEIRNALRYGWLEFEIEGRACRLQAYRMEEVGSGGPSLFTIDVTGRNEQRVATPSFASDPAWSPLLS